MFRRSASFLSTTATLLLAMTACASTRERDMPAVIARPDSSTRATLQAAVNDALHGAEVLMSDDALTKSSVLIVERVVVRDSQGRPAQGRERRLPERFRLFRVGAQCVLLHERTGKRIVLHGIDCTAQPDR